MQRCDCVSRLHARECQRRDRVRTTGQLNDVWIHRRRRRFIHRRRVEIEPSDVAFIDASDRPDQIAVALSYLERRRQLDLMHQRVNILSRIHSLHCLIVHVLNGIAVARQPLSDVVVSVKRQSVARHGDLRFERQNSV